jgi:hypothetical protein
MSGPIPAIHVFLAECLQELHHSECLIKRSIGVRTFHTKIVVPAKAGTTLRVIIGKS